MRVLVTTIMSLSLLLIFSAASFASSQAHKFFEYGAANCETEMEHLDRYTIEVLNAPNAKAYVIVYGGRRGTSRAEVESRKSRIKRYLVNNRMIESERVSVIDGGFRESLTVEVWLVPDGAKTPEAKPTVKPQEVRYKRAKYSFDCSTFY